MLVPDEDSNPLGLTLLPPQVPTWWLTQENTAAEPVPAAQPSGIPDLAGTSKKSKKGKPDLGPTLFDDVTAEMSIYTDEIFGPVLSVVRASSYEQALELISQVSSLLDLQGLMGMGPVEGDPRPAFNELRAMHDEAEQRVGRGLPILSMGMSGDFEAALAAGSTLLRLGQALFGPRAT